MTRERFQEVRKLLGEVLVERDEEISLVLTALLAGENLLLVGPPGVAKSLLLDGLTSWAGGRCFKWLMTKFTEPAELYGGLRVEKEHRTEPGGNWTEKIRFRGRESTRKLQEADFCFLDEIWKASSAILNTLLRILNERTYDDGEREIKVPLKLCVAASNEWPNPETGKDLNALFDRFLLRKEVQPVRTAEGSRRLLREGERQVPAFTSTLPPGELDQAQAEVSNLAMKEETWDCLETILAQLRKEGIIPGDRRRVKAPKVARAYAWLEGSDTVEPGHLEVLAHVLWDDPQEQPRKCAQVIASIANPTGMKVNSLRLEAEEILAGVDLKNLGQTSAAVAKLGNILKELKGMPGGNGRVRKAVEYVGRKIRETKLASLDSV